MMEPAPSSARINAPAAARKPACLLLHTLPTDALLAVLAHLSPEDHLAVAVADPSLLAAVGEAAQPNARTDEAARVAPAPASAAGVHEVTEDQLLAALGVVWEQAQPAVEALAQRMVYLLAAAAAVALLLLLLFVAHFWRALLKVAALVCLCVVASRAYPRIWGTWRSFRFQLKMQQFYLPR